VLLSIVKLSMSRCPFLVEIVSSELTSYIRPRLGQVAASCTPTSKVYEKGSRFSESDFAVREHHHHTKAHDYDESISAFDISEQCQAVHISRNQYNHQISMLRIFLWRHRSKIFQLPCKLLIVKARDQTLVTIAHTRKIKTCLSQRRTRC
jgi:hypothetical protein